MSKFRWILYIALLIGLFSSSVGCEPYILAGKTCDNDSACASLGKGFKCDSTRGICACKHGNDGEQCICSDCESKSCCESKCIDTKTNQQHCGVCGNKCAEKGSCCIEGKCTDPKTDSNNCGECGKNCGAMEKCCGGMCYDLQSASQNCGNCGISCTKGQSCCKGKCANFQSDPNNCGVCGKKCPDGQGCCKGICVAVQEDTNEHCGKCGNNCKAKDKKCCKGICYDLQTDNKHCGACGKKCADGQGCCKGICVDLQGNTDEYCGACRINCKTDGKKCCQGTCYDLQTSNKHCGKCNNRCESSGSCCQQGACTNPKTDQKNCGTCGNVCVVGKECCNKSCNDFQSDPDNCGKCGTACGKGQTCCKGKCIDLKSDNQNCGVCGNKCQGFQSVCKGSKCVCPDGGLFCNGLCLSNGANCVERIAGNGNSGLVNGEAHQAQFNFPRDLALDLNSNTLYIADTGSNSIRKLTPKKKGVLCQTKTMTGDGYCVSSIVASGKFDSPNGLSWDNQNKALYIADTDHHKIFKYSQVGGLSLVAGSSFGFLDAAGGQKARFRFPKGLVMNTSKKTLYVADTYSHVVRIIRFLKKNEKCSRFDGKKIVTETMIVDGYCVTTVVGYPRTGLKDGVGFEVRLTFPRKMVLGINDSTFYIADTHNHSIRKLTLFKKGGVCTYQEGGVTKTKNVGNNGYCVTTVAGIGKAGFKDGPVETAQFHFPIGLAFDRNSHTLYVADSGNHRIRKVSLNGFVTTLAGSGVKAFKDGAAKEAQFDSPNGLVFDKNRNTLYIADSGNHCIRGIRLSCPSGLEPCKGTCQKLNFVSDTQHCGGCGLQCPSDSTGCIQGECRCPTGRVFCKAGGAKGFKGVCLPRGAVCVTTAAGNAYGFKDGAAHLARFLVPKGIGLDQVGNLYIAGGNNNRIRKLRIDDTVLTIAGTGVAGLKDGAHTHAQLNNPAGVLWSKDNNGREILYIADTSNHRLRVYDPVKGTVTTLHLLYDKNEKNRLFHPGFMAFDGVDSLFISDAAAGGSIWKFNVKTGRIHRLDISKHISHSRGVAWDQKNKTLYVASIGRHRILALNYDTKTQGYKLNVIAGSGKPGFKNGVGTLAEFNKPHGLAFDEKNQILYVADLENHKIRKVSLTGQVTTLAGTSSGLKNGAGNQAQFNGPYGLVFDAKNNTLFTSEYYGHVIRKLQLPK